MKKTIITSLLLLFLFNIADAQQDTVKYWKREGRVGLNFAQGYLSNWAAGGTNSLNTQGILQYSANYAKDNHKWDNSFDFLLGYSIFGDEKPMKTDDRLEINSLYGKKLNEKWFSSLAFSFKTQTNDGFDYKVDSTHPISKFFAPAYVTLGLGAEWSPHKIFSVNIAPLTARGTFVTDQTLADAGSFGVDGATYDTNGVLIEHGKNFRFEFGGKVSAKLNVDIAKNVNFLTKLEFFSNYIDNPQNVDVDWQAQITMKINSWMSATIMTQMIYDDDIDITDKDGKVGPRTQFKETFNLGLRFLLK